jgi:hypothetical protein
MLALVEGFSMDPFLMSSLTLQVLQMMFSLETWDLQSQIHLAKLIKSLCPIEHLHTSYLPSFPN